MELKQNNYIEIGEGHPFMEFLERAAEETSKTPEFQAAIEIGAESMRKAIDAEILRAHADSKALADDEDDFLAGAKADALPSACDIEKGACESCQ